MRIGELAARAGLEVPTIRYYETLGLISPAPRTSTGYRQYFNADVERLAFIKHNQALGFTLREIRLLTPLHSVVSRIDLSPPTNSQELQSIAKMLEGKQLEIDKKIAELKALRHALVRAIRGLRCQPVAVCPASVHPAKRR